MTVDEVRSVFSEWKATDLSEAGIEFKERFDPPFDPHDDYRVIYESSFEPIALDKARIEFWVTDEGFVAVGIEKFERITKRLGLKAIHSGSAAGHEPTRASRVGLQLLFDAVTTGNFRIVVRSAVRIVTSIQMYVFESDYEAMERSGYNCSHWYRSISNDDVQGPLRRWGQILKYQPWLPHPHKSPSP